MIKWPQKISPGLHIAPYFWNTLMVKFSDLRSCVQLLYFSYTYLLNVISVNFRRKLLVVGILSKHHKHYSERRIDKQHID